jgi:2-hydroxychromene-2-carboxylate isomerase
MNQPAAGDDRPVIDYYFSVLSDWAYMGGERFENLARRHNARINHLPMKLAQLYEGTGGIVLQKRSVQRQDYRVVELERWRDKLGMPITLHPKYYPTNDTLAACSIIAAAQLGLDAGRLANLLHRAIWAEEQDLSDEGTLRRIIGALTPRPETVLDAARSPEALQTLERNTREAGERGVFGSPFYIFEGQIYWGQDRLDFLDEQLARNAARRLAQRAVNSPRSASG